MDTATFAAERREILVRSDDDLRPLVEDAFDNLAAGAHDWSDDLILSASVLWLEIYEAETGTEPDPAEVTDYQERLLASLEQTAPVTEPVDPNRVNLTTVWVSTFTVNDATSTAAAGEDGASLQWVTMHDEAVRDSHVLADGQRVPVGQTFDVGGYQLAFPGDPVGPPDVWINCRCVVARVREDSEMTANLSTDVALAAAAPVVEEDGPPDVELVDPADAPPEWDEDQMEVEVPWHGVVAPTGVKSGDRRRFAPDAMRFRDLPVPLRFQKIDAGGHDGSFIVANIENMFEEDGLIKASGRFTLSPESDEAIGLVADGMLRGVSVDLDDVTVELQNEDGTTFDLDTGDPRDAIETVVDGRVASAALVSIPAFQEAYISLGTWDDDLGPAAVTSGGDCAPCAAREMDAYYAEVAEFAIAEGEWDGSAGRFDDEQWQRSTVVDRGPSFDTAKTRYAVPIREPNGDLSRAGVHAAASRINQVDASPAALTAGKRKLVAAYRQLDEDPPEVLQASAVAPLVDQVEETFAPGTRDGPGWVTNPEDTQRLRNYWTKGTGAAKIRWGQPGDFNRCRRQLAKYVPNPNYLAGTCANLHKVAMGIWPGQHAGKHAVDALTAAAPAFRVSGIEPEHVPPRAWFADPQFAGPTPLTVTEDGQIFGHLALWDTCHIGLGLSVGDGPDCVTAPPSTSGYAAFMNKSILTDDGLVAVGNITMDTGHAPGRLGAFPAAAHYDNTGNAAADVVAGEDAYGIWVAGAVRPGTDVQALRGATLSGDWRTIGGQYDLVAALAVNVPGFAIPRLQIAASGVHQSLVAAGVVTPAPTTTIGLDVDVAKIAKGVYVELTRMSDRAAQRQALATKMRAMRRAELTAAVR
jgi:hypothetical protein